MENKEFFQLEIIINVLIGSFWFIWIPMLWVYGHYIYCDSFSAGIEFIRENLRSTDVRFWLIKEVPALRELTYFGTFILRTWYVYVSLGHPSEQKTFVNICTMLVQRRRRWTNIVQMLYKCFVFAGIPTIKAVRLSLNHNQIDSCYWRLRKARFR